MGEQLVDVVDVEWLKLVGCDEDNYGFEILQCLGDFGVCCVVFVRCLFGDQ